jgi:hypothetical protein
LLSDFLPSHPFLDLPFSLPSFPNLPWRTSISGYSGWSWKWTKIMIFLRFCGNFFFTRTWY